MAKSRTSRTRWTSNARRRRGAIIAGRAGQMRGGGLCRPIVRASVEAQRSHMGERSSNNVHTQ